MSKRKRTRRDAKRNSLSSADISRDDSRRARRTFVIWSTIFVAVVVAAIVGDMLLDPNRVSKAPNERPDTEVPPASDTPAPASKEPVSPSTTNGELAREDPPDETKPPSETVLTGEALRAEIGALEKEAIDAVEEVVEALPGSSDPLALIAMVHLHFGNTAEAMQWWEKCLRKNPNRPDVYDGMAKVAKARGEYDKAVELWGEVLRINPRLPGIRAEVAQVLIDSGELEKAIVLVEEELELSSREEAHCNFLLGKAYLQSREYEKAREPYETAVQLRPEYSNAWYGLVTVYSRLGNPEAAKRAMSKFQEVRKVEQDADNERKRSLDDLASTRRLAAEAHAGAGATYASKGYLHKAELRWKRAAELDPKDGACRTQLAKLYLNSQRYSKALPVCEQLVSLDPDNPMLRANLGMLYSRLNRLDDALAELKLAREMQPENAEYKRLHAKLQEKKRRER